MRKSSFVLMAVAMFLSSLSCSGQQKNDNDSGVDSDVVVESYDSDYTYYDMVGHPESEFNYYNEFTFSIDDVLSAMGTVEPNNIKAYIDDVIADGKFIMERYDVEGEVSEIRDVADKLQAYKDGKRGYFPNKELKQLLVGMMHEIAYVDNHRPGVCPRDFIIFPRLLEIGASLCPDITMLAAHTSNDKRVGVVEIPSNYNSLYTFTALITKAGKGCKISYLPESLCRINKVRYVGSNEYNNFYVLTYEDGDLYPTHCPNIYLVALSKNDSQSLWDSSPYIYNLSEHFNFREWRDFIDNDRDADNHCIYFNPKEISWSWCKMNQYGNLEKMEGSKSLYVDLEARELRLE